MFESNQFFISSHTYHPIEIVSSLSYDQHNLSSFGYVDKEIKIITINIFFNINKLTDDTD